MKKEEEEGLQSQHQTDSNASQLNQMQFQSLPRSPLGEVGSPQSQADQSPGPNSRLDTTSCGSNFSASFGDWQYDIDPTLVSGFDNESQNDPEGFFNEHLSQLIHTLWS